MTEGNEIKNIRSEFFNNAELHFIVFDKNLNVIDINDSLLKYYHLDYNTIIGKNVLEIGPDIKEKGLYDKYLEVIRTGKPIVIEDSLSHPKFGNQHNRIKVFKVGDGIGITASNITELKDTISALESFSYKVTHDINSPIASILGITNLALNGPNDINELKMYLELAQESAKQLINTLNQINKTLRIQKGDTHVELINFEQIILDVKKSLTYIPGYNVVRFEENIEIIPDFYFDKLIIISLFQNLIDNAIKYRNEKRNASFIKINVSKEEDSTTKVTVTDNGIGIIKDLQKNIFKLFYRATNQSSGNGIGLYTLRYGIEKLGGHIKFESEENIGTTFTIYLPNKNNFNA
ncbi:PAS domain-containing sensor histidine kinase [Flavobacterium sufflavum]|uniref:histidine kinase n=1 Tax=Flavobacterium sufflavum TaxID=1921138 RepID=A0A437L0Q3_9FLAO|nr:HAMP domain-containing sensor histidine kinase [Flavobacterium sufflavum]RVT78364.1 PAS domain-containing sensor histidine kinase [Flavobacterium sufflavum]